MPRLPSLKEPPPDTKKASQCVLPLSSLNRSMRCAGLASLRRHSRPRWWSLAQANFTSHEHSTVTRKSTCRAKPQPLTATDKMSGEPRHPPRSRSSRSGPAGDARHELPIVRGAPRHGAQNTEGLGVQEVVHGLLGGPIDLQRVMGGKHRGVLPEGLPLLTSGRWCQCERSVL